MSNFARKKRTVKKLCSFFRMEKGIVEVFSHLIIYIILNNSQKNDLQEKLSNAVSSVFSKPTAYIMSEISCGTVKNLAP